MALPPSPYDERLSRIKKKLGRKNSPSGLKAKLKGTRQAKKDWRRNLQPNVPGAPGPGQVNQNPPLPWSAQYETGVATHNRNLDFSNLDYNQQEQRVKQAYGFDDKSNPYSRAAMLQRQYQQNRNQTLNSYASQGQLYSGSLSNARNLDRYNYDKTYDTEERNYQAALADIASGRLKAQRERDEGITGLEAQRVEDALSQAPDPAESPKPPPKAPKDTRSIKQLRRLRKRAIKKGNTKRSKRLKKKIKRLR